MLTAEAQETLTEVHLYMGSDAGRSAVREALSRRRLPGYFDVEIEEAVLGEALRFLRSGGEMTSPAGWCRARITARAVDLARGALRDQRRFGVRVAFDDATDGLIDDDQGLADGHTPDLGLDDDLPGDLDGMRRTLVRDGENDASIAGALSFVTLIGENAPVPAGCPQPATGATGEEAAMWAVLWHLGHRDCFGAGNTQAKRRSRAARGVRDLLRSLGGGR